MVKRQRRKVIGKGERKDALAKTLERIDKGTALDFKPKKAQAYVQGAYMSLFSAFKKRIVRYRKRTLVPSTPPTCEVLAAYQIILPIAAVRESWMYDYHGGVGTVAHTIIQKWFGRLGILYGKWKCPEHGCGFYKITSEPSKYVCPEHRRELVYEEFQVNDAVTGMGGKCDGLLCVPPNPRKDVVVCDFKFVGPDVLKEVKEKGVKTTDVYYEQVNVYGALIEQADWFKKTKKRLVGTALMFINKANIKDVHIEVFDGVDRKPLEQVRRNVRKVEKLLLKWKQTGQPPNLKVLVPKCASPEDAKFCPAKDVCFIEDSPEGRERHLRYLLNKATKERLNKSGRIIPKKEKQHT